MSEFSRTQKCVVTTCVSDNTEESAASLEVIPIRIQRYEKTHYRFSSSGGDGESTIIKGDDRFMVEQVINNKRGELISYVAVNSFLAPILRINYGVSTSDQEVIVTKVWALACHMTLAKTIIVKIINIVVVNYHDFEEFRVILQLFGEEEDYEEDTDSDVEEDEEEEDDEDDETILGMMPAAKSSIEKLEKVEINWLGDCCCVCMEELPIGLQVARMPCSHIFHTDCICKWLGKSCRCPLCRFQIP